MAEQLCMGCMNKFDENDSVCPYCGYRVDTPPAEPYHLAPGVILVYCRENHRIWWIFGYISGI